MNWTEVIDNYCERTDAGLLSEPLNLLTNLAYLIAAGFLWRSLKSIHILRRRPGSLVLVGLIFLIGIGSATFHSVATRWAMIADVVPIGVFLISFLYCFLRWEVGLGFVGALLGLGSFGLLTAMTAALADRQISNGSEMYFGAWTALFGIGCYMLGKQRARQRWLTMFGSIALSAALLMRTLDMKYCADWPLGTHFLWHVFTALTLFAVTKSYIINSLQDQRS